MITMNKRPLIILTGPTAVGKTSLSVQLAKCINGEIISADSMQVYKGMDIGSAKIMSEEMCGVPHHLIDILEPWEEFNVVVFQQKCKECMEEIYKRGHIPVLAGGTGFYIQAVLRDIDFTQNEENTEYRSGLEQLVDQMGQEEAAAYLDKSDCTGEILVVDNGHIVQRGTHAELAAQDGIYRTFVEGRQEAASWKIA